MEHNFIPVLLCAFLVLPIAGCANTSTQGILGSSESVNESGESDSPATVVVKTRDEQPETSRQWFALTREEKHEKLSEALKHQISCLEDKGWKIEKVDLKNLGYSVNTQNDAALEARISADTNECNKRFPRPDENLVMSIPDIEDIYEYRLTVKACLENEGIKVTDPPTKQKFIDDFRNDRSYWNPYTDLMNVSNLTASRFREITEKCPQW
ncbi:hypothetical protein [Schaalia sp. lx-260]|uniref:hypothetical protein n=1 Tax=Schaalia sp. lx-260 TaxID=2899082 RepID=UPI001E4C8903|nr:hypothetical protein [Schaalia sp. lx-260]MCD4549405.1 hypothetical protein [Schaalia sp. lx-260]